MTFLANLFGGGAKPKPTAPPPPPAISDAAGEAAARELRNRARAKTSSMSTLLSPETGQAGKPLGSGASVTSAPTPKTTMLGG